MMLMIVMIVMTIVGVTVRSSVNVAEAHAKHMTAPSYEGKIICSAPRVLREC
ncbi:MAG: hypothetical protein HY791_27150 [Deltaproteobacteria bacterium]|nr:hypothetical protein [Deltaproteobacteria bacterium]